MPIYYKKVSRNSSDAVSFLESRRRFSSWTKSKEHGSTSKDPIELDSINLQMEATSPLMSSSSVSALDLGSREQFVQTRYGKVLVSHQGLELKERKPVIVTYHDIGLNYVSNFEGFFSFAENKLLLQSFPVLHINAPGQDAERLPAVYRYPTFDELANQVREVLDTLKIKNLVGFGCGAGANVLSRFALKYPDDVDGLFLINPNVQQSSWVEWFYQKKNVRLLVNENGSTFLPESVQEYLLWYHFGKESEERDESAMEIIDLYRTYFKGVSVNPYNLGLFIDSYLRRTPLGIERNGSNFKCQVVAVTGSMSPHLDSTLETVARMDPKSSSWLKISDCAMVLEEKPFKVAEAFRLFLQGLGHTLKAYEKRRALMSGASMPCLSTTSAAPLHERRMTALFDQV